MSLAAVRRHGDVTADPVLEFLRELSIRIDNLAAGQAAIMALLERRQAPAALSQADRARLSRLLPAVSGTLGSEPFSSRDLVEEDRAAVRLVVAGLSVKALSKLLARADGVAMEGLMVQRHGRADHVTAWRVVRAVGLETVSNPARASRIGCNQRQELIDG